LCGAARISLGRCSVIVGIVPVAAPLVDIVANVIQAERVGGVTGDGLGTGLPAPGVVRKRLRRLVAPGIILLFEIAAGSAFPLGFGGKTVGAAGLRDEPLAIAIGIEPRDAGDGLPRMVEVGILPEGRWLISSRLHKALVVGIRDLSGGEKESVDPDPMDGAFAILTRIGAHEEPGSRDRDEQGFEGIGWKLGVRGCHILTGAVARFEEFSRHRGRTSPLGG